MHKIEIKIILSIVFFTILIVGLERYQLSSNIMEQFIESKKSKNRLLIDTITPIVSLNLSLGLDNAYKEYLNTIAEQNNDIEYIRLIDADDHTIFDYVKDSTVKFEEGKRSFNYCSKDIVDSITDDKLASIILKFSNKDYENMINKNRNITINLSFVTLLLLTVFILLVKRVFKHLKKLTGDVLSYDPKENNFPMTESQNRDEIALIHNAIISMVLKINSYTNMLDTLNASLEDKVKERTKELEFRNKELKLLASTDPLTKLYNRRYFTKTSAQILAISKRNQLDLSIIMLDVDEFKRVNDTYGHAVGDDVLIAIATTLKEFTRESDVICRFGGEEFIILLPETNVEGAKIIAEKIRLAIKDKVVHINNTVELKSTVSIGVSQVDLQSDKHIETSIHRADKALYEAKETGKDKVCIYHN